MNKSIGHALVAMYGRLSARFIANHDGGYFEGAFNPDAEFDPVDYDAQRFAVSFKARYGVERGFTVGEALNGKNFYPDVIEYLLYHPNNPLDMTPEAIRSMTTPPIGGTREWMVARQDCCCVMVGGLVAMEALEKLASVHGYGVPPQQPAKPQAVEVSELPELAPVKVRQGEIGHDAGLWWGLNAPRWAQGLLSQEAFDYAAAHAAGILIPIARRYAERIAQRTAEIVLAKLEERR